MIKTLFQTFFIFSKISLSTFGGGYSMMPQFYHELVDRRQWLSETELANFYALAQCQPGAFAVNTAVLVSTSRFGAAAGFAAAAGIVVAPVILILLLAFLLNRFSDLPQIAHAMAGIKVVVAALVLHNVWLFLKTGLRNPLYLIIFAAALVLLALKLLSPILTLLLAAAAAISVGLLRQKLGSRQ
jgi:chromate transporter